MSLFDDLVHAMRPMTIPVEHLTSILEVEACITRANDINFVLDEMQINHLSEALQERVQGLCNKADELGDELRELKQAIDEEVPG